jgi:hypothetical protein
MKSLRSNLWNKFKIINGCWIWIRERDKDGYGEISVHGIKRQKLKAHRVSWEVFKGPIPLGLNVLHKCDNPPCINPDHLFLGTQKDNIQDMITKGRKVIVPGLKGEANPTSKLKSEQVKKIKSMLAQGIVAGVIAKEFGVARSTISMINIGRLWRDIK